MCLESCGCFLLHVGAYTKTRIQGPSNKHSNQRAGEGVGDSFLSYFPIPALLSPYHLIKTFYNLEMPGEPGRPERQSGGCPGGSGASPAQRCGSWRLPLGLGSERDRAPAARFTPSPQRRAAPANGPPRAAIRRRSSLIAPATMGGLLGIDSARAAPGIYRQAGLVPAEETQGSQSCAGGRRNPAG